MVSNQHFSSFGSHASEAKVSADVVPVVANKSSEGSTLSVVRYSLWVLEPPESSNVCQKSNAQH